MEDAVKVITSLWEQFTNAPVHMLIIIPLMFFGMLIKKSPTPNWIIPWALIILGVLGYPRLASPKNIDPDIPDPGFVLMIFGGMLGVAAVLAHGLLRNVSWFSRIELAFVNAFREDEDKETLEDTKKGKT